MFFIKFLEEIFSRFSSYPPERQDAIETLLLDLHKLLGRRLVPAALHSLDYGTIVIYSNNQKTIEIVEFCDTSTASLQHLFLHLNYCTCEYFKETVLIKQTPCAGPYLCHHILAVRLARTLNHKCLEYKEVPTYQLDLLLNNFF